jgi:hypothetical protein
MTANPYVVLGTYGNYLFVKERGSDGKDVRADDDIYKYMYVHKDHVNASTFTLNPSSKEIVCGESFTIKPSVSAEFVSWSSNNKDIADVKNGVVTANNSGRTGAVTITATGLGKTATCRVTVKDLTLDKILDNIDKSANILSERKATAKAAAEALYKEGFKERAFIAGFLAQIAKEGSFGNFEIYWGGSNQSYMVYLVNNHNYEARFGCAGPGYSRPYPYSVVSIYQLPRPSGTNNGYSDNLKTVRALSDRLKTANVGRTEPNWHAFGLGMVQWTRARNIRLIEQFYEKEAAGRDTITQAEVMRAETNCMIYELTKDSNYTSIYRDWSKGSNLILFPNKAIDNRTKMWYNKRG